MDRKKHLHVLFMLLLFAGMASATNSVGVPGVIDEVLNDWRPVMVIILFIGMLLAGIVYMFGNLLMNEKIKAWAKFEAFELVYSLILLILILSALDVADRMVLTLTLPDSQVYAQGGPINLCGGAGHPALDAEGSIYRDIKFCHMRLAIYFLHSMFTETNDWAEKTYTSYIISSTLGDFTINVETVFEKAGFITFNPWKGIFALSNKIKEMSFEFAIKLMMLLKFQQILLSFISKAVFPVMFSIGIILRSFAFTRKLGGLLMAMALALFFIFPMFYDFGAIVINNIKKRSCDATADPNCIPKITPNMYINGTVPTLERDINIVDEYNNDRGLQRIREKLSKGQDSGLVDRSMVSSSSGGYLPNFDLCKRLDNRTITDIALDNAKKAEVLSKKLGEKRWYDQYVYIDFSLGGPIDSLARIMFFTVFFSLFAIMSTISAIKTLSPMFGGDVEIAGLTHLI